MSSAINQAKVNALKTTKAVIDCLVNIQDETGEFLMPIPDGRIIDTKGWNNPKYLTWEWSHGVGLYGLWKLYEIDGDEDALRIMLQWFKDRLEIGTTKNVNTVAPLLTAAYLQEAGKGTYTAHLDSWAEWVMYDMPRTDEGGLQHITYLVDNYQHIWDDTLMMSVLPLAKIGLVLKRPHYIEEAKRQFLLHVKYLADPKTGLWFHGWTFEHRNHFSGALWGRGNCWVTIAIPDFIEMLQLPPSDGVRIFLVNTLIAQIDALVKYQDSESGLWHTLITDPSSYLEASATAGFAYGIMKALRLRLIPRTKVYEEAAKKALQGVLANISEKGELQKVSFGTPIFDDLEGYRRVPLTSMPYGQSLALLALTEYLRTFL